jgi:N-acetyl-anhydromuramyl-L-alanine amidase AmpD
MRGATLLFVVACAGSSEGPVARSLAVAADKAGVPAELLTAIAVEEGGVKLAPHRALDVDDNVPVAGALELRHGRLDTLALGAELMATTENALRVDFDLGTRAGALVLAQLGAEHGAGPSLESWRGAVEALSGLDEAGARAYADRVFELLRKGGNFPARGGETLHVAAHGELPVAAVPLAVTAAQPDYPDAIWIDTSCTNKCNVGRPLGNASVDKIVIHDTEGDWDAAVATLQNDSGKSVHYIIDSDGARVGQFRAETDTTWHAGNYFYNETSIGIEHVGFAADSAGYSDGLYATSEKLVTSIRSRWNVPLDRTHIIGHYQIPNGDIVSEDSPPCTDTLDACETSNNYGGADNHRDPGYYWQWCQYMEHLGGSCTCSDAWPLWNCTSDRTEAVRCTDGQVEIEHCNQGCESQAIGVDDVCHEPVATGPGSDFSGEALGSAILDPNGVENKHGGGCNSSGIPPLWLASLVLLVTRRRVV